MLSTPARSCCNFHQASSLSLRRTKLSETALMWDEVSVLDDRGKLIRTFEVCNVNHNPRLQDNWLATPFLFRDSAPRVFVTLRFSVRDCASLRSPSPTCRETLTLYYKQADSQRELERTWAAEYQPNRYRRVNIKTRSFAPLTRNGRPQSGTTAPRMHCNAEGEWMVPVGGCVCDGGYEPNVNGSDCLACPVGYFKSVYGSAPCSACPSNSRTGQEGSLTCECRSGFYRSATDANSSSCTRML
ncbi:hypothetical protein CRUP_006691 [Coryphaenoides rupestris]|nr:hypothetical protein CRUP_006691 [Coryphaenoides rupestris]